MNMSLPAKPLTTMTKKSYNNICQYILQKSPEDAEHVIKLLTEALRETTGFDPNVKRSSEECKRIYEQQKSKNQKPQDTYTKYGKTYYEKRKQAFPNTPPGILMSTTITTLKKTT